MSRSWLCLCLFGVLLGGCQQHAQDKQAALDRWHKARAQMAIKMAQQQFQAGDLEGAADGAREVLALDAQSTAATLLLGRTSPAVLAAYLQNLDLLITNDTGPMHLAAAMGTPCLALFLASARVQDTGPVGTGHVILEPRLDCHPCPAPCPQPRCHQAITPDAVSWFAQELLNRETPAPGAETDSWRTMRVYVSSTDPQ